MKLLSTALIASLFGVALIFLTSITATPLTVTVHKSPSYQLGAKQCTWGPSYWCTNITNAKSCNAMTHCIQTVWTKHDNLFPEDNDSICQICLDMVKQARDQLESNETQDELRQVFEGSCNLIPIKTIAKECDKLVDDFIPQLIEALASQMEPNAVCSIAGLCNNANIDRQLAEYQQNNRQLSCDNCNSIGKEMESKFKTQNRDDLLENMLEVCGKMSSFSDACSNIVLTYFNEIYATLNEQLKAENICHMSGVCSANFHNHEDRPLEIKPMSGFGVVSVHDDIPCELCEQLVQHLREVLIANTTELEFKQVLEGLCNQTKGFQKECLSIVDQYYDIIYQSLVNNLDAKGACYMIGICHPTISNGKGHIMPLVPVQTAELAKKRFLLGQDEPKLTATEIQNAQLPLDRLMGAPNAFQLIDNGEWCTICEYFLHFIQDELASPKTDAEIKEIVSNACNKFPQKIASQCHAFVDMYGDAIMALLIQNINPAQICPTMKFCPSAQYDTEVFFPIPVEINQNANKPTCPLCLFAVTEAIQRCESDKSKKNIEQVLEKLCTHLPSKMRPECNDFVETYSSELVDMLAHDFTPVQICVYFKLCNATKLMPQLDDGRFDDSSDKMENSRENDILTNEIPDNTINGVDIKKYNAPNECSLCVIVLKEAFKSIDDKTSTDDINKALDGACGKMRKWREPCEKYLKDHRDTIVKDIKKEMTPKQICHDLGICPPKKTIDTEQDLDIDEALTVSVIATPVNSQNEKIVYTPEIKTNIKYGDTPSCIICTLVMQQIEEQIKNKSTQDEIRKTIESICTIMPRSEKKECQNFIDKYAGTIIQLIATTPPKMICSQMMLCSRNIEKSKLEVIECAVCQGAVQALDAILDDKKVDEEIEETFEKACHRLPGQYYKKCDELVDVYGISLINIIRAERPETACNEIGMCFPGEHSGFVTMKDTESEPKIIEDPVIKAKHTPVGLNECTYGPAHWCSNPEIAKKCNVPSDYCVSYLKTSKSQN